MKIVVNGRICEIQASADLSLLDLLRDHLHLKGTKAACRRGECGACTVLVAGRPIVSCLALAMRVRGDVETIEGLGEECADLAAAMADTGGFQCGFCTSGQIVRAAALLRDCIRRNRRLTESEIRHELSGNICRCTGYSGIVKAISNIFDQRAKARSHASVSA